jgi:hypothetical protein
MRTLLTPPPCVQRRTWSDGGIAAVVVLYGLSAFSVLSLTVLRNAALEKTFQTAKDPDLHVVMYAGGAGSPAMVARLNLPTLLRNEGGPDASTEVRIPGAPHLDLASELPDGWTYAVQLSPDTRVCCDGGDGACSKRTANDEAASAVVTPPVTRPFSATGEARSLQFSLSSLPVPPDVQLDPNATAESAFLIRASRVLPGSGTSPGPNQDAQRMSCRLESADREISSATLRIQPGLDENRSSSRISTGTLELSYRAPGGAH